MDKRGVELASTVEDHAGEVGDEVAERGAGDGEDGGEGEELGVVEVEGGVPVGAEGDNEDVVGEDVEFEGFAPGEL